MRLDINSVTFKNFYSFGNIPVTWNITPGLHLITGKNLITNSGNGNGKCIEKFTELEIDIPKELEKHFK